MKHYSLMVEHEYAKSLVGQIFKILPLYEEKAEDGYKHVRTTIIELRGLEDEFREFNNSIEFIRMLGTLKELQQMLYSPSADYATEHAIIRCEVLKMVNWLNGIAGLEERK